MVLGSRPQKVAPEIGLVVSKPTKKQSRKFPFIDSFNLFPVAKIKLFSYALSSCVYKETKDEAEILGSTAYLVNQLKDKFGIRPEEIIRSYERLTLFNKIVDFCKESGALPTEIRLGNVGISSDGRFVIIDSSVEETIKNIFK